MTGLDRLCRWLTGGGDLPLEADLLERLRHGRWGLLTHAAAVDAAFTPCGGALRAAGAPLAALFGPEHGVAGQAAAGEKVASGVDPQSGLPVHSLYGEARRPTAEMLEGLDLIVVDLQDVGARFYTYPATLSLVMEAAEEVGLPVLVLDRPNPIGGIVVEGPVLEPENASFVGPHPTPIRHGLTLGELARLFHAEFGVGASPHVLPMESWDRARWPPTRSWAPPSPNIPTPDAALLYPGVGLLEGTNMSEGRGTAKPFEWVGAPWIDSERWAAALNDLGLLGVRFRPVSFVPTTSKHQGMPCNGVQVHLLDRDAVRPVTIGVALLQTGRHLWRESFEWLSVPGSWLLAPGSWRGRFGPGARSQEPGTAFKIDRLAGTGRLRRDIEADEPLDAILWSWYAGIDAFEPLRRRASLYP
jgi:uncharacterized protein YbbC (DUF1343 family)